MNAMLRRNTLVLLTAMGILATIASLLASACSDDPARIGVASGGARSMAFVGRIDQAGERFVFYGYLTHVDGIEDRLLFTNPDKRDEATARLTIYSESTMTGRSILENIFSVTADGTAAFYSNEVGGASFTDPSSFQRGTEVASAQMKFLNQINVIAPNQGISTGSGELTYDASRSLTIDGEDYAFAQKELRARINATGSGVRLEPVEPRATILISGDIVSINVPD